MQRRTFLGLLGAGGLSAVLGKGAQAAGAKHFEGHPDSCGVLFDATRCIGCRRCEAGCNKVNNLPAPPEPFDD
jgi:formate dehydrogenase iron-sulfur subunit